MFETEGRSSWVGDLYAPALAIWPTQTDGLQLDYRRTDNKVNAMTTPGDRIRMIVECVDVLNPMDPARVTLTLGQHGLGLDHDWSDHTDTTTATTNRLAYADDSELSQIHEYLTNLDDSKSGIERVSPGIWTDAPCRVFLSHLSKHAVLAAGLRDRLAGQGMSVFVAHDTIGKGALWREQIKEGLASCDALVALLHEGFHASEWCDQEVGWALGRGVLVIPVWPAGHAAGRDGFLEETQGIRMSADYDENSALWYLTQQVFDTITASPKTRAVGVSAAVEAFANSASFDNTRRYWQVISRADSLTPAELRRLEWAVDNERQVYEAVEKVSGRMIPELVEELVKKFEPEPESTDWGDTPF